MALEVIGAGLARTGTTSLKAALEELGFDPCYHASVLFGHPEHVEVWEAAARGESVDWNRLFGGYWATTDWPACLFYEELMQRYPDAKVILTMRDPNRWYESTTYNTGHLWQRMVSSPVFRCLRRLGLLRRVNATTILLFLLRAGAMVGLFRPGPARAARLLKFNRLDPFDGNRGDRQQAIEVFKRHNEEVRRRVPVEGLLVYEVKEGWGPLCDFLGVEEPDKPFSHLNETNTFRKRVRRRITFALAAPIAGVSLAGLVLLCFRKRSR